MASTLHPTWSLAAGPWPGLAMLALGIVLGAGLIATIARWQLRRILARQLAAERRARAAERLAELGAMTGGLAHEIKNPLSTIGLNAQLLSEGIEDLPDQLRMGSDEDLRPAKQRLIKRLDSLRRESERLRGILTDFLAYAGELRLDIKPTDLHRVLDELADFFSPQAQQQGVRLRLDFAPEPITALVDGPHLKQAILNLMLNALQAMQANSQANVSGGSRGVPKELIIQTRVPALPTSVEGKGARNAPKPTPCATISIIDTGPGIAPEARAKLFQPYFTTRSGGSGLGLATTRRLAEAMGGRIEVVSELGKGAQFTIWVPMGEGAGEGGIAGQVARG